MIKSIITALISIVFLGIVVLLCFSCCYLSSKSDEYWDEVKKELEKRNERR